MKQLGVFKGTQNAPVSIKCFSVANSCVCMCVRACAENSVQYLADISWNDLNAIHTSADFPLRFQATLFCFSISFYTDAATCIAAARITALAMFELRTQTVRVVGSRLFCLNRTTCWPIWRPCTACTWCITITLPGKAHWGGRSLKQAPVYV